VENWPGDPDELPVHLVTLSTFEMSRYEVTQSLYEYITGGNPSMWTGDTCRPVEYVSWQDAVNFCNMLSLRAGLEPCYTYDGSLTTVTWNTAANGYRLPTEAEWEKAARGGLSGKRFPWGDLITHTNANYYSSASYSYDVSSTRGNHPTYDDDPQPYTSPVGSFAANGYGLKDMAGNLWEWCWDWYDGNWYSNDQAIQDNTRGPASGSYRVMRGGSWGDVAVVTRCANRVVNVPDGAVNVIGFRCVRGL
jgi:formylglycine-generating enzyme required for sulfatase activity